MDIRLVEEIYVEVVVPMRGSLVSEGLNEVIATINDINTAHGSCDSNAVGNRRRPSDRAHEFYQSIDNLRSQN